MKLKDWKLKGWKYYLQPLPQKGGRFAEGNPLGMGRLGLLASEMATFVYAAVTVVVILFTWTNIPDASSLLLLRLQYLAGTIGLWVVGLLWPCRLMMLARVCYLLAMLGTWYPDTYAINSQFGSLDHVFAGMDQQLFGMQPSLIFSQAFPSAVVSELMCAGYFSYYLFFVVTLVLIFFRHFAMFERASFIVFAGFYICYVVYLFLPVTGPQYYYLAAGLDNIAHGTFPDVGHYFRDHQECLAIPGWEGGLFHHLVQAAHQAGERPTAAFPSSHVAIATLVMAIATRLKMWRWLLTLAIPYCFLCLSTVYIYAHYAVDAMAGFVFGLLLFFALGGMKLKNTQEWTSKLS